MLFFREFRPIDCQQSSSHLFHPGTEEILQDGGGWALGCGWFWFLFGFCWVVFVLRTRNLQNTDDERQCGATRRACKKRLQEQCHTSPDSKKTAAKHASLNDTNCATKAVCYEISVGGAGASRTACLLPMNRVDVAVARGCKFHTFAVRRSDSRLASVAKLCPTPMGSQAGVQHPQSPSSGTSVPSLSCRRWERHGLPEMGRGRCRCPEPKTPIPAAQ